jgi:hypothetical protein
MTNNKLGMQVGSVADFHFGWHGPPGPLPFEPPLSSTKLESVNKKIVPSQLPLS